MPHRPPRQPRFTGFSDTVLTAARAEWLFHGFNIFDDSDPDFRSEEHARSVWATHRDELLAWWVGGLPEEFREASHRPAPGLRPFAWWKWEAREEGPSECAENHARLVELGVLSPDEITAFAAASNRNRF